MEVRKFPDFFEESVIKAIYEDSKVSQIEVKLLPVFRGTKNISPCPQDFLSQHEVKPSPNDNEGKYACSVYYNGRGLKNWLRGCKGRPETIEQYPYIVIGALEPDSGLCRRSKGNNHVNWWIYEDFKAKAHNHFKFYSNLADALSEQEEEE